MHVLPSERRCMDTVTSGLDSFLNKKRRCLQTCGGISLRRDASLRRRSARTLAHSRTRAWALVCMQLNAEVCRRFFTPVFRHACRHAVECWPRGRRCSHLHTWIRTRLRPMSMPLSLRMFTHMPMLDVCTPAAAADCLAAVRSSGRRAFATWAGRRELAVLTGV